MELQFLGSGGNFPVPTPTCSCGICEEARREGVPYARNGNSMYLPGMSAMIDAPEQTLHNLNREGTDDLEYVLLTHWHPDHVCGIRAVQSRDYGGFEVGERSWIEFYLDDVPTVVTTRRVYERTCELTPLDHLVENESAADVHFLDEEPLSVGGIEVRAIPYSLSGGDDDAVAFVFEDGDATLVVASDDARYLDEDELPDDIDLAVFECGLFHRGPDGRDLLSDADRTVLVHELDHEEVLARIDRVDPGRTVLTEIDHLYGRTYDDYRDLERSDGYEGIRFAYDGLTVEI